jgi:glycosyltransferase involved in cell wall biosynthesis
LYVGRVEPAKGIETLVRALGALPSDAVLDVVGRGDVAFIARVKGVAAAAGAEARLRLSSSARENLADRYAAADAVVFPSEWNEPFGIVPLEAMACGTPVVATGTGGSGEYLRDSQNCLLVPPGSATALGQALHRLAADPGLRSRLIQGGRVTAEALTTDRLAATLQDIHKEHSLARQAAPRNRGATVRRRDGGHDAVQL